MNTYFYDAHSDTVRRYPDLVSPGERFDKELLAWLGDSCCPRSGCKWDKEISQDEAQAVLDRQSSEGIKIPIE